MKTLPKHILFVTVIILLLLAGGVGSRSQARSAHQAPPPPQRPYDPSVVLVKLKPGVESSLTKLPGARHLFDDWYRLPVQRGKTPTSFMAELAQNEDVLLVTWDERISLDPMENVGVQALSPHRSGSYPNDPYYNAQWHLPQVQSDAAWNINRGQGVIVAVVDTGVSRGDDLNCRTFVSPYDAITNATGEAAAADRNGHGTHVAGTIGQCTNNNRGVAGMAPDVKLMPVRALGDDGDGSMSDIAAGINWAANHGADVINLSLESECNGDTWPSCSTPIVNDAITNAVNHDVVIIAASGNENNSVPGFPANHPEVIAVAAVDYNEQRAYYSNKGAVLDISAPGGDTNQDANHDGYGDGVLQQTFHGGLWDYYFFQGTSMAAPHVAGAAALLRSYVPGANRNQIRDALIHTAKDLGGPGRDNLYGYGLLQTADALAYLHAHQGTTTPTPTPTITPTLPPMSRVAYLPLILRLSPPLATPTPAPTPTAQPPVGIYGRVTYNYHPGAGLKLTLRQYNANSDVTVATTYADGQGNYRFAGVPTLPSGYKYYVRYGPNAADDSYVYMWFGPNIENYHQGEARHGGDFDIANVSLQSPPNRVHRTLPVTFSWERRVHQPTTYRWVLWDTSTNTKWRTQDLGNAGSFTLTSLPSGVSYGKEYGWYPMLYKGSDSFGLPFYYRLITFDSSQIAQPGDVVPLAPVTTPTRADMHAPFAAK